MPVSVAIASAHLGAEGCTHDESSGGTKSSAAGSVSATKCATPLPDASPQGTGLCGGPCDFSSAQLSFVSASPSTTHVQIGDVALLDADTGMELQALSAYTPLVWDGTQYSPWDENVSPFSQIKTSYTLSPPAWSMLGPSFTYSHQYQVRITVLVDGVALPLESPPLTRPARLST
jgi:hypothetical protein